MGKRSQSKEKLSQKVSKMGSFLGKREPPGGSGVRQEQSALSEVNSVKERNTQNGKREDSQHISLILMIRAENL